MELSENRIFANQLLPIDLGGDFRTANDADDSDTGANGLQNFPVLATMTESASGATLIGTLTSLPNWGEQQQLGAHAEQAVQEPRTSWLFAEGSTGCFDLFYLLVNPGAAAAEVDVTFVRPAPQPPIVRHQPGGDTRALAAGR